ncbi:probable glycosyltransferase At5g03795 [Beta vulgaris subsp. vulgaris]|uniref:probable glycosyltransferase At5g03795 n=1 Tax=Beta vulgaris subsp. vulgaris TaxID=3555 RepID=UPI002036B864|nr:probable glycosyltransferase At5g03795 [Beta vulgaris subsp. vulgaris]
MKEENKRMGYCYYWSPIMKLIICFTIPLIFVCGFVSFIGGPNPSNWVFNYHPFSSSARVSGAKSQVSTKDLRSNFDEVIAEQATTTVTEQSVFSTPPLAIQAASPAPPPAANEDSLLMKDKTPNTTDIFVTIFNETHAPPMRKLELEKVATDLDRLEIGLQQSRAAIKEAKYTNRTYDDPDFKPLGPMYWNANAFHRSYLEMERRFKVYVYEEGEPPLFHNGPCKSIYSTEGNFIHLMEINNQFRTKKLDEAHVFFLPFSVVMMVHFVYLRDSHDFGPIRQTVRDYINVVSTKYPYWNRSLGADHFMLSCHDWGPETSFSVPYLAKNSIRVLCNANTSEGFKPQKDVSLPEINLRTGAINGFVGGPSPSRRSILAFFAGGLHGPIRPILLEHWGNKDDKDLKIFTYLPKGVSYYDMLRNSKFCICPSGYEVASPRVVEAIYTGCVPVLISDHYVPPFSDVLNWKSFSVEVSVKDIPNLKTILTNISTKKYLKMYRRVLQVRRHFEVHAPPKRYDFFHMILHSVWLRRLNVHVHDLQEL